MLDPSRRKKLEYIWSACNPVQLVQSVSTRPIVPLERSDRPGESLLDGEQAASVTWKDSGVPQDLAFGEFEEASFPRALDTQHVYDSLIPTVAATPGLFLLTGEAGAGKSMMVQRLCDELRAAGYLVISRYSAGLSFRELLTVIDDDLGLKKDDTLETSERIERLHRMLSLRQAPPALLAIDHAERLGFDVLYNLEKLLTQTEASTASLRILLSGDLQIASRIDLQVFGNLKAKLVTHYRVGRLKEEVAEGHQRLKRSVTMLRAAGLSSRIKLQPHRSLPPPARVPAPVVSGEIIPCTDEKSARSITLLPQARWPARNRSRMAMGIVPVMLVVGSAAFWLLPMEYIIPADHAAGNAPALSTVGLGSMSVPDDVSVSAKGDELVATTADPAMPLAASEPRVVNAAQGESHFVGGTAAAPPSADDDRPAAKEPERAAKELPKGQELNRPDAAAPIAKPSERGSVFSAPAARSKSEASASSGNNPSAPDIDVLQRRGDQLVAIGDIAGARLYYERAAAQGSARAATSVGNTYDPAFLSAAGVRGMRGDPAAAAEWYGKAARMANANKAAADQE